MMKPQAWLLAVCAPIALACEAGHFTGDAVRAGASPPALTADDIGRSWIRLAVPQPAHDGPYLVRDPQGFVVLGRESTGSGKVVGPTNNYLYRSDDGITWRRLPLPEKPEYFFLRDLAYGDGRYVMVGNWGNYNEIWSSGDLATWSKLKIAMDWPLFQVKRVQGHFFALSVFRDFLLSDDGLSWSVIPSLTVLQEDIAYGHGRFVLVGSGPIRSSRDGHVWEDHPLDCALPDACIRDPSGGIHQAYHPRVVFGGDRFYVDRFVSSDGASWQLYDGPVPHSFLGGYFFRAGDGGNSLEAWRPGEAPAPVAVTPPVPIPPLAGGPDAPAIITAPLPGGETCLTHRCVQLQRALYLIR